MHRPAILAAALAVAVLGAASAKADINLGVLANRGELAALSAWTEFANNLAQSVGEPVKVVPLPIGKVLEAVETRQVQFMITNPVMSAAIVKRLNGTPLATIDEGDGVQFGGVIIANRKSGIKTGADLKGRKVMCYTPSSAGAYVFQRYHLLKQDIDINKDLAELREAKKQDDIVLAVRAGLMDAGFVRTGLLESMAAAGKIKLDELVIVDKADDPKSSLLRSTALYPGWFLTASPATDPATAAKVQAATLAIGSNSSVTKAAGIKTFAEPVELEGIATLLKELRMPPFDD